MVRPEFGSDQVKFMLVLRELYGMKLSRADFRGILSEQLHDLGYRSSISNPGFLMRPSFKTCGFMCY